MYIFFSENMKFEFSILYYLLIKISNPKYQYFKEKLKIIRTIYLHRAISKVTNSGAARVAGGLAPSFFDNMSESVSRMHIALYFMIR